MTYQKQSEELRHTRRLVERQTSTQELARFETTFFALLELVRQEVDKVNKANRELWFNKVHTDEYLNSEESHKDFQERVNLLRREGLKSLPDIVIQMLLLLRRFNKHEDQLYVSILRASLSEFSVHVLTIRLTDENLDRELKRDLGPIAEQSWQSGIVPEKLARLLPKNIRPRFLGVCR